MQRKSLTDKILELPHRLEPYCFISNCGDIKIEVLVLSKGMVIGIKSKNLNGLHIQKEIETVTKHQVSSFIWNCSSFYHISLDYLVEWKLEPQ